VNNPAHYTQGKFACIDAMVSAFGPEAAELFCRINAFKYIWRSNDHGAGCEQNVQKALWYLNKSSELRRDFNSN
jgi:TPR repeat protein